MFSGRESLFLLINVNYGWIINLEGNATLTQQSTYCSKDYITVGITHHELVIEISSAKHNSVALKEPANYKTEHYKMEHYNTEHYQTEH